MESKEDIIRVKQEPNDTFPDVGDDNNRFDSVDTGEAKNIKTFPVYKSPANHTNEVMALQENFDGKIFIDVECKGVKLEPTFLSTTNCKIENQSCQSIVKKENENQIDDISEKVFIDFECKGVKSELKFLSTTNCKTEQPFVKIENQIDQFKEESRLKLNESEVMKICGKRTQNKSTRDFNQCRKNFEVEANPKTHINMTHKINRPYECEIFHKSFSLKSYQNRHISTVHKRSKPFECHICHESFGYHRTLKNHISVVHDRSKLYECTICHKSFSYEDLKKHVNSVHDRSKPFKCAICHKLFEEKSYLTIHINTVHIRRTYGSKKNLKVHTNAKHN